MSTTALTVTTETTSPASRVMDTFHAAVVFYTTGLVKYILKTNLSCGTTLYVYAMYVPLPVTRNIYRYSIEKLLQKIFFGKKLYFFIVFSLPKNTADACTALIRLTVETPMQKKKIKPNTTMPRYVTSSFLCS